MKPPRETSQCGFIPYNIYTYKLFLKRRRRRTAFYYFIQTQVLPFGEILRLPKPRSNPFILHLISYLSYGMPSGIIRTLNEDVKIKLRRIKFHLLTIQIENSTTLCYKRN